MKERKYWQNTFGSKKRKHIIFDTIQLGFCIQRLFFTDNEVLHVTRLCMSLTNITIHWSQGLTQGLSAYAGCNFTVGSLHIVRNNGKAIGVLGTKIVPRNLHILIPRRRGIFNILPRKNLVPACNDNNFWYILLCDNQCI